MFFRFVRKFLAWVVMVLLSISPLQTLMFPVLPAQAAVRQLTPGDGGVNVGSAANGNVIDLSNIVSDGSGGFYIAWSDLRDGDGSHPYSIYVQRFNDAGTALNGNGGTKIANVVEIDEDGDLTPALVASASGDVIATWRDDQDSEPGTDLGRMFTQAIDTSGNLLIPSLTEQVANLEDDSFTSFQSDTPTDTTLISHPINAGANRYTFVTTHYTRAVDDIGIEIDSVTWDGQNFTPVCVGNEAESDYGADDIAVVQEIWYMGGATPGTNDLTINWAQAPAALYVDIETFRNVNTSDPVYDFDCLNSNVLFENADGSPGSIGADSFVAEDANPDDWQRKKFLYGSIATSSLNGITLSSLYGLNDYWANVNVGSLTTSGGTKGSALSETNEYTEYGWSSDIFEPWAMSAVLINTIDEQVQGSPAYTGLNMTTDVLDGDFTHESLTDGNGGQVTFSVEGSKVYGQRVDNRGIPQWGADGIAMNPNGGSALAGTNFDFDYDGTNYFGGWGNRDGANNLVAQKINSSGAIQWNTAGSPEGVIIDTTGSQGRRYPLGVTPDEAGGMMMLFARAPISTGTINLQVQHLDSSGNLQFGSGGIELHSFSSNDSFPFSFGRLIKDDDDNFIALWTRTDGRVYAQKFDIDGTALWPDSDSDGGVRIGNAQAWANIDLISDGQGGAFVSLLDTSTNEMVIQGIFENGGLLWSDFYTVSEGTASGQPRLFNIAPGEAVVAWEEDRDSAGVNAFFLRFENYYQIRSLNGDLFPEDSAGNDISFGTANGVKDAAEEVTVIDEVNEFPVSQIDVNLTQDRDWAGVSGDVDSVNAKSFVANLTAADGAGGTHTLYVPYDPAHIGVTICPDATSLAEVTADCAGAVTKTEADSDTSIETVNGKQVWAITGMTGTGGFGLSSGGSELTFAEGGSIQMLSPKDYTNDHQPKLKFKKAVLGSGSVTSYNVTLDDGMWRSFQVKGIPAQGNGQADYVWRDDDYVRVTFYNEQDDDPANDEIHVFFKDLSNAPLTEGKHGWGVTVFDNAGAQSTVKQGFSLDLTNAEISELSLADEFLINWDQIYYLDGTQRTPGFAGRLSDIYRGSVRTNENGSVDTFIPVSSGPKSLKLSLEQLISGELAAETAEYSEYWSKEITVESIIDVNELEKYARFYLVPLTSLANGGYKVIFTLTDQAGNQYEREFYISIGPKLWLGGLNLLTNNLQTEIETIEQTPAETEEDQQLVEAEGAIVTVSVVDQDQNQLGGIGVTLVETQQSAVTDDQGQVIFPGVVAGAYTVEIATDSQTAEQKFNVDPGSKEVAVTIQVTFVKEFYWQGVLSGLGLAAVSGALIMWLLKRRK